MLMLFLIIFIYRLTKNLQYEIMWDERHAWDSNRCSAM